MPSPQFNPTNRGAVVSIVAATLTLVAFCLAVVPIPLTGFVCFPSAAALGIIAVTAGLLSLRRISQTGQKGRELALVGVWIGAPAAVASLCMVSLGIVLVPRIVYLIRGIAH